MEEDWKIDGDREGDQLEKKRDATDGTWRPGQEGKSAKKKPQSGPKRTLAEKVAQLEDLLKRAEAYATFMNENMEDDESDDEDGGASSASASASPGTKKRKRAAEKHKSRDNKRRRQQVTYEQKEARPIATLWVAPPWRSCSSDTHAGRRPKACLWHHPAEQRYCSDLHCTHEHIDTRTKEGARRWQSIQRALKRTRGERE